MNGYTETESRQLVDLKKIARIDVVQRDADTDSDHFRWVIVLLMNDDTEIVYLSSGRLASEINPCYSLADAELSDDERDTMNQVATELMLDVSYACADEENA